MSEPESQCSAAPLVYKIYGLRIRSEIPLGVPSGETDASVDLTIALTESSVEFGEIPDGETLASFDLPNGRGYVFKRGEGGSCLRFHGECEFRFNEDLSRCDVRLEKGRPVEIAGWLLKASVPALLLGLRGEPMLHASAIEVDGKAVAVAGESGMGKSTVAAVFCAAGRRLVSDDLLRLDFGDSVVTCFPGGAELRLRDSGQGPSALFDEGRLSVAVDGRVIARCEPVRELLPLAAVLVPKPEPDASAVRARCLSKAEAGYCLNKWPRVAGWEKEEPRQAHFKHVAELVRRVPVVEIEMPAGPPFQEGMPDEILRALGGVIR